MKTWMMTIPLKELTKRELLFRIRRRAKRWQFGVEVGAHTGYEHYQIRYECSNGDPKVERAYWGDIRCELSEAGGWSNYECKDGNYYQSMDDTMGKYRFGKLKNLQSHLKATFRKHSGNDRQIIWVIDNVGGSGKTHLGRSMELNGSALYIIGGDGNLVQDVYDIEESSNFDGQRRQRTIIIDYDREGGIPKGAYQQLERIKNGKLQDRRYHNRDAWILPPVVVVFTNQYPNYEELSEDRWYRIFINKSSRGLTATHYAALNERKGVTVKLEPPPKGDSKS